MTEIAIINVLLAKSVSRKSCSRRGLTTAPPPPPAIPLHLQWLLRPLLVILSLNQAHLDQSLALKGKTTQNFISLFHTRCLLDAEEQWGGASGCVV